MSEHVIVENRDYSAKCMEYEYRDKDTNEMVLKLTIPDKSILENAQELKEIALNIAYIFNQHGREL